MSELMSMRDNFHGQTMVAVLAAAVAEWKNSQGLSRETVTDAVSKHFHAHHPKGLQGVEFQMTGSGDEYTRMHSNANKLFRWLDDLTKEGNLLPVNLVPYLLGALPMQLRTKTINTLLSMGSISMSAKPVGYVHPTKPLEMLEVVLTDTAEVSKALAALVDGIDPGELEHAQQTLTLAINSLQSSKAVIDCLLSGKQA